MRTAPEVRGGCADVAEPKLEQAQDRASYKPDVGTTWLAGECHGPAQMLSAAVLPAAHCLESREIDRLGDARSGNVFRPHVMRGSNGAAPVHEHAIGHRI